MSGNKAVSQELDFEDVVAQFERDIASSQKKTTHIERDDSGETDDERSNVIMDMGDLAPDLQVLCEALMEHLQSNSQVLGKGSVDNNNISTNGYLDSGVTREVFRAEIKATLTQMKTFRESELETSEMLSQAERSTINSLKRQVRERDEQLNAVKQQLKQAQIAEYRLQDSVNGYQVVVKEYEDTNELLENQVSELQNQNADLTKRCSDADVRHRKDNQERDRMTATLTQFRRELLVTHQKALNARTEARQAKKRAEHLEARAAEDRASSAAVSLRIKELKDIQDQMVAIMRGVQESGDNTAARRVFAQLAEQRSRLVGRIANLLTRKKKRENSQGGENQSNGSQESETSGEKTSASPNNPSSAVNNNSSPSDNSNNQNSDIDGLNRKQRFESFRKLGSDLTRITTGRKSRRVVMKHVEQTCEAVERDTETLQQVVEMKQNEIQRMEEALAEANIRAATFEMALEKERQKRKLENRNMRNSVTNAATAEMSSFTTTRRKKSTLFEWQSEEVNKGDNNTKSAIATTASTGVRTVHSNVWGV